MYRFIALVALVLALTLSVATVAQAKEKEKKKEQEHKHAPALVGTVKSVDTDAKTFVVVAVGKKGEQANEVTVTYTDATAFKNMKKASTAEEVLKVDNKVRVTHTDGVATEVCLVPAAMPHHDKDKGKDKDKGEQEGAGDNDNGGGEE
ncbi:MAG: hypothetical protein GC164_07155 [Phycisphaera sp.]|nr:hypothetical protein [Phycisphaera sp.]